MQRGDAWAAVADRLGERYPSVLLERADEEPEPGALPVGYSMGGRILLHAALAEPERWPALVLVGVSAGVDDPPARRRADEELAAWVERRPIEDVVARWEEQPVFATQTDDLVAAQREGRLAHDPAALARMLRTYGQGVMPSVWDRLEGLAVPVLLLAGALDEKYAAAGERKASLLPRGRFRTIPRTGHAPQLEDPDAVAAALREFLDQSL